VCERSKTKTETQPSPDLEPIIVTLFWRQSQLSHKHQLKLLYVLTGSFSSSCCPNFTASRNEQDFSRPWRRSSQRHCVQSYFWSLCLFLLIHVSLGLFARFDTDPYLQLLYTFCGNKRFLDGAISEWILTTRCSKDIRL
jgi:hypothetical protein